MESKLPLSRSVLFVIFGVVFAIAIGGYILFFQSQKRIAQKDHEYELLKTKVSQSEEGYNDLQKKYDAATEKMKQLTKDNESMVNSAKEQKTKHDELQAKFDALTIEHEKLTKELKEKASAPAASPASPTSSTPTTPATPSGTAEPKSSDAHPVSQLNQQQNTNLQSEPAPTPAVTITPPSPPPDPLKTSLKQTSAISAGFASAEEEFHCPPPATVTKNLNTGKWNEGSLTWYVDYTRRPLNENEPVQKLFQTLFDGQTVACYYELSANDENAWIIIKGSSKTKLVLKEADGWTPCPTKECEATCPKESLNQCHFNVQKL